MNCRIVGYKVNGPGLDVSELGALILQCKYILSQYSNYNVKFVKSCCSLFSQGGIYLLFDHEWNELILFV